MGQKVSVAPTDFPKSQRCNSENSGIGPAVEWLHQPTIVALSVLLSSRVENIITFCGLSVHLGGCVVPGLTALVLLSKLPLKATLLLIVFGATVAYLATYPTDSGLGVLTWVPGSVIGAIAFIVVKRLSVLTAFASGVFSCIIGADLLNLHSVYWMHGAIGGGGGMDAIPWMGVIAAATAAILQLIDNLPTWQ